MRSSQTRAIILLVLLGTLFGFTVWYGTLPANPDVGAYPDQEQLGAEYTRYLGEEVTVSGLVVDTAPIMIAADYGPTEQTISLEVTGLSAPVPEGHELRVYGVAQPDRTIRAIDSFSVPPIGLVYTLTISFLAGCWTLARIVRDWRFDRETWTLQKRAQTLPLSSLLTRDTTATLQESRDDA